MHTMEGQQNVLYDIQNALIELTEVKKNWTSRPNNKNESFLVSVFQLVLESATWDISEHLISGSKIVF